jgi:CheY-like chemotaxis protein
VELPAVALRPASDAAPHVLEHGSAAGARVVIIDDDAAVLHATRTLLEQWGWSVVAAPSLEAALQQLASTPDAPDLLVCDLRLGGGATGVDAVERLRDEFNQLIPALLVTGEAAPTRLAATGLQRALLLHKPLTHQRLRAGIDEVLQAARDDGPQFTPTASADA